MGLFNFCVLQLGVSGFSLMPVYASLVFFSLGLRLHLRRPNHLHLRRHRQSRHPLHHPQQLIPIQTDNSTDSGFIKWVYQENEIKVYGYEFLLNTTLCTHYLLPT